MVQEYAGAHESGQNPDQNVDVVEHVENCGHFVGAAGVVFVEACRRVQHVSAWYGVSVARSKNWCQ